MEEVKEKIEEVAETPKGRAAALAAYKAKYADRYPEGSTDEPEDDEMYDDMYRDIEDYKGRYDKSNRQMSHISAAIAEHPEFAEMLANYDESDLADNIKRNQEIREANSKANAEFIADFIAWADKNKIPEDKREETFKKIMEVKNDAIFDFIHKGMNYDSAVEAAATTAKNAEIERKKLAMKSADSAYPDLSGGGSAEKPQEKPSENHKDFFSEFKTVIG